MGYKVEITTDEDNEITSITMLLFNNNIAEGIAVPSLKKLSSSDSKEWIKILKNFNKLQLREKWGEPQYVNIGSQIYYNESWNLGDNGRFINVSYDKNGKVKNCTLTFFDY